MPMTSTYTCPYCRIPSDGSSTTCPHCGAPVDVREKVSRSGWAELPPIRDMARIRFSRSTCQISGAYVPVAEMNLAPDDWVYFSHHVLLHTDLGVRMNSMQMGNGWTRMLSGMPLIMMIAQGPGSIAFSDDHPGELIAVPLQHGQSVHVLEHRFLVATGNVKYAWQPSGVWYTTLNGNEREYHYPCGMNIDHFWAEAGPGLLMLHAPGNVFIRDLGVNDRILIQPSALIWKDPAVRMNLHFEYPGGNYWFSSARYQAKTVWLALHGPGRIAMSSVFRHPEVTPPPYTDSGSTRYSW
jgi:uncharacterized protein (AIM24 family)